MTNDFAKGMCTHNILEVIGLSSTLIWKTYGVVDLQISIPVLDSNADVCVESEYKCLFNKLRGGEYEEALMCESKGCGPKCFSGMETVDVKACA